MTEAICLAFTAVLVLTPLLVFAKNRDLFRVADDDPRDLQAAKEVFVSVCIPARNEERSIGESLRSLMASTHRNCEVLVLDDHSTDRTSQIVQEFLHRTIPVRVLTSEPLPPEWNGKQFACWQLANKSLHPRILFIDADVRLAPDAITRMVAEQDRAKVALLSGFPKQVTGTFAEKLLIPMMHYILLCYLPIHRMRASTKPEFAAGCGQIFLAKRAEYFDCGGHEAIRGSRHDGIQLPKAFRKNGLSTDIFDASDIATCRMYTSTGEVFRGLLKNATEGIANSRLIVVFSLLLIGGTWLPLIFLWIGIQAGWNFAVLISFAALFLASWAPRFVSAVRFHQSFLGALLHPFSILAFLAIQWYAFAQDLLGIRTKWRGRV